MIQFTVRAVPVAQPRARATSIGGMARLYEAKKSHPIHAFKASVRLAAAQEYSGPPLDGPLYVCATFVLPRPKSATKKRSDNPRYRHTGKPDCDNLAKSVLDSLNGTLFTDDSQVCELHVKKFVAAADEQPHVVVTICPA